MRDRYLRIVLTVIAVELFWLGIRDFAVPVAAQQPASQQTTAAPGEPMRVVIAGIDIAPEASPRGAVPVTVRMTDPALRIQADPQRPLRVEVDGPIGVTVERPVQLQQPVKVEQVPYTPSPRPGD